MLLLRDGQSEALLKDTYAPKRADHFEPISALPIWNGTGVSASIQHGSILDQTLLNLCVNCLLFRRDPNSYYVSTVSNVAMTVQNADVITIRFSYLDLRFSWLRFDTIKLLLSGMSDDTSWKLSIVIANIAAAILFTLSIATAMFAEMLNNFQD